MLTTLRIRNLALVTDLTVEFGPGLNVITGETGAGKSILLGALSLVLGERADRSALRSGADACTVEALFHLPPHVPHIHALLSQHGLDPCAEDQLALKRSFTSAGANRQFVNGSPVTLQQLAALGQVLVDMHGPHEHQSLLHPAQQLAILDAFGRLDTDRAAFAQLLADYHAAAAAKSELVMDEKLHAQQLDLLRHQVQEIESAQLDPGEEAALQEQHQRAQNAAKLLQLGQTALQLISADDTSLLAQAGVLGRILHDLHRTDPAAAPLTTQQEHLMNSLQELQAAMNRYLERIEVDPQQLQAWEERLNLLQSLKRKYGPTLEDVLRFGSEARRKYQTLEQRDVALARLQAELDQLQVRLRETGQTLSTRRRKLIPKLARTVSQHLASLGFARSQFDIGLLSEPVTPERISALSPSGLDRIEFQFAPNPGEPARPLRAIASSGEMARAMLALKTALAAEDQIPVLIFDEVDANVGGETARAVGEKMLAISAHHQVFCVTHLAPVAAFAQAHFRVSKRVIEGRTVSEIAPLDTAGRLEELTRMLGGPAPAARQLAESLLSSVKTSGRAGTAV